MAATAPTRFTFDLDLGHRQERTNSVSEAAMVSMLADARTAGYAEGFTAGEHSASARSAQQLAQAAAGLGDRVAAMAAQLDDQRRQNLSEAVGLASAIARKLATALLSHQPTAEIEALITDSMSSLDGAKHLVIRCRDDLADGVREIAEARMQTSGFAGRLVVIGDPEIKAGDCRIEWADGGVVRDVAGIGAQIDARIAAFLAARGIHTQIQPIAEIEPSEETMA